MTWPKVDWSHNERDIDGEMDNPINYHRFDKYLGQVAYSALSNLSVDLAGLETDHDDWTVVDSHALVDLKDVDHHALLMVPPSTTPLEHRFSYGERMASLRTALPFAEAERHWLFRNYGRQEGPNINVSALGDWREVVRTSQVSLVSTGISRTVSGRDLLQRWWSWRREVGEYADQGSLDQARYALEGVVELLAPELGLPEAYVELRASENRSPEPPTP